MSKKKKKQYPEITSTYSATDTTGMMPTVPRTPEEYRSYQELSGMEIPQDESDGK